MVRKILMILCAAVLIFSGYMLWSELSEQQEDIDAFRELAELVATAQQETQMYTQSKEPASEHTQSEVQETEAASTQPTAIFKRNLTPLIEKNSDCIGWICIPETTVDYPVMHTPDWPQKYLRKNFDGAYSRAGVPFLQANANLQSDNLIIYGHNMNNGTMFSDIVNYRDAEYCKAHPLIELETEQGCKYYRVFAVVRMKTTDPWYDFLTARTSQEYDAAIETLKTKALFETDITPQYGQQLITLSTCYGSSDEDRLVVVAAEVVP